MLILASLLMLFAAGSGGAAPPQAPPPQPPRAPERDARPPADKGTAVISGRVLSADGGRPLRRAQIRLSASELSQDRTTSTNGQGMFEVRGLPAGRYTVGVTRSGYLPVQHGQRRPGEPGRPLHVEDGQKIEELELLMPRAGAISGQILDETGDPVAGVNVYAMQPQYFRGRRRLVPISSQARTDDTGMYRVLALPPGDYVVMAVLRETWVTRTEDKRVLGYAPSYFPGTPEAADAQRVKLAVGQEVSAVDFSLVPGRAATLSGTAMRADGTPLAGGTVGLSQEIVGPAAGSYTSAGSARVGGDGTWTLRDVAPGEYRLSASASNGGRADDTLSMMVNVQGIDLQLALVTGAPASLAGQVVTDTGRPLPAGAVKPRIVAVSTVVDQRQSGVTSDDPNGLVGADGRFTLSGLTGPVMLQVFALSPGWTVRSVELGGRDYAQAPLEVPAGQDVTGAKIVVTDSFPTLNGRVTDGNGAPAEGTVILFPSDASRWIEAAGLVQSVRLDQTGRFRFPFIRPGDYLIAALDYVESWRVGDPEFLEDLRRGATKLTLREGANDPVTLTLQK